MYLNKIPNNCVIGTGTNSEGITTDSCLVEQQRSPAYHPATADLKRHIWSKEDSKVLCECYNPGQNIWSRIKKTTQNWTKAGNFEIFFFVILAPCR